MAYIELHDVVKDFKIKNRRNGAFGNVKNFFAPQYLTKRAVDHISLEINRGEMVGYIGPTGAGKSTPIKILTGILLPTSGYVKVGNLEPYKNRKQNALHMGAVFGQRSQLLWDLPVQDALDLFRGMYRIEEKTYKKNVEMFCDLLGLDQFLMQPARQLSLGQKMRANLALALIHDPDVVYLDEPTIGLDVLAKDNIRAFLREINKEKNTTVLLTTHDMTDIESVCDRLVLINSGSVLYDGGLNAFKEQYSKGYSIRVTFADPKEAIQDTRFELIEKKDAESIYHVSQSDFQPGEALAFLASHCKMQDISIIETPIEEIVKAIYKHEA